jgi:hypothetical protein
LPHGKLVEVDDDLLTVVGRLQMPLAEIPRRMTVVRLRDRRLVIYSAIALDEIEMAALEDYGDPAFMVVPGDHHRLDAHAWKQRYPRLVVAAPAGARDAVEKSVHVDTTAPFFDDPAVQWVAVPGTRQHEAALVVKRDGGTTLVLNDLVANIRNASGFGGWLLKVMGFAGDEPHIPAVRKLVIVKDAQALREQLLAWSDIADLRRILVSHGDPIDDHPRRALCDLAASLA